MYLSVEAASPEMHTNIGCQYVIYCNSFSHIVFLGKGHNFTSLMVLIRFCGHFSLFFAYFDNYNNYNNYSLYLFYGK